jgi:hypothetical protein
MHAVCYARSCRVNEKQDGAGTDGRKLRLHAAERAMDLKTGPGKRSADGPK